MRTKPEMIAELSKMLTDVFTAKRHGGEYARLARAHGYVDGYMRAMLESGACSKGELLQLVAATRAKVDGPALRDVALDSAAEIAAA